MRAVHAGAVDALHPPDFALFLGHRRRRVGVKCTGLGLRDMPFGQTFYHQRLLTAERAVYVQPVAHTKLPMRLDALAVHLHLSGGARPLCLGSSLENTSDVQPDIEADSCIRFSHCTFRTDGLDLASAYDDGLWAPMNTLPSSEPPFSSGSSSWPCSRRALTTSCTDGWIARPGPSSTHFTVP